MSFTFTDLLKSYAVLGLSIDDSPNYSITINDGFCGAFSGISGSSSIGPKKNEMDALVIPALEDLAVALNNFPATNASTDISGYNWSTANTLTPGSYYSSIGVFMLAPGSLTFNGSSTDTFYIYIHGSYAIDSGFPITFINGACPENVFWKVYQTSTITGSTFAGNLLAESLVSLTPPINARILSTSTITMFGPGTIDPCTDACPGCQGVIYVIYQLLLQQIADLDAEIAALTAQLNNISSELSAVINNSILVLNQKIANLQQQLRQLEFKHKKHHKHHEHHDKKCDTHSPDTNCL